MCHGRGALLGLAILVAVRVWAWQQGDALLRYSLCFGLHLVTASSDVVCLLLALPLFATGPRGKCVSLECFGPMLTLVFVACMVDFAALAAFLVIATPRPVSPESLRGSRWEGVLDVVEANVGVWEFALVGSVAFQVVLCASSWRIYKELRMAGLYPPGQDLDRIKTKDVSLLEVVFE